MPSILIVSDSPEDRGNLHPVLRGLLSQAGIEHQSFEHLTVFPTPGDPRSFCSRDKIDGIEGYPYLERGWYVRAEHASALARFHSRVNELRPNVILALGLVPMWALCRISGIDRWRGTPMPSHCGQHKVIVTWPPSSIIKQWELRAIAFMDFCKAKRQSTSPLIIRPRRIIHLDPTLEDIASFYEKYIVPAPFLAADTETKAGTITEIGFATSADRALVIPFWHRTRGNYWKTKVEEREAWAWVRRICVEKPLIGQNFQYDMNYLWRTVGIPTPRFAGDTMLLHHSLQPELKKGLGFLGSIYTDEPSWKFMRTDHTTLKREDD